MEAPDRIHVRVSLKGGVPKVTRVQGYFYESREEKDLTSILSEATKEVLAFGPEKADIKLEEKFTPHYERTGDIGQTVAGKSVRQLTYIIT